jgi:arylsulfatase A-like enzyme
MTKSTDTRPNIIFICTDQQHSRMMSCAGNGFVRTPAMDRLAATGVRFDRAYCTDPVCVPSRFSLFTGLYPSAIGMRSNGSKHIESIPAEITASGIGWRLGEAGYDAVYAGKQHLPKMKAVDLGFEYLTKDERDGCAAVSAEYIQATHDKPYFLVVSFINPHDICYMAIRDYAESDFEHLLVNKGTVPLAELDRALERPEGMSEEEFFESVCPPLPPNFEPQEDEPEAMRVMQDQRQFKRKAREQYSAERWRMHRWAYARLTERVDGQVGTVMDALERSGAVGNTVVIFSSDHGDMDASHRMEHKTALYDEATRVPLIISQPGTTAAGTVESHLVCNGLDLIPTVCDYAEIEPPEGLEGVSLRGLAEGTAPAAWRSHVRVESEFGEMVVTERHKYMVYDEGANREQLIDQHSDPWETRNAAYDPENAEALRSHRDLFRRVSVYKHFADTESGEGGPRASVAATQDTDTTAR